MLLGNGRHRFLNALLRAAVDDHACAFRCESCRYGKTDSGFRSGDQRDLVFEMEIHAGVYCRVTLSFRFYPKRRLAPILTGFSLVQ